MNLKLKSSQKKYVNISSDYEGSLLCSTDKGYFYYLHPGYFFGMPPIRKNLASSQMVGAEVFTDPSQNYTSIVYANERAVGYLKLKRDSAGATRSSSEDLLQK